MDINDEFGPGQTLSQLPVLLFELAHLFRERIMFGFGATLQGMAPPGDPKGMHGVLTGTRISYEQSQTKVGTAANRPNGNGETSSFSIADRFGNLVSVTHSVNGTFGSGIVVQDAGFV